MTQKDIKKIYIYRHIYTAAAQKLIKNKKKY